MGEMGAETTERNGVRGGPSDLGRPMDVLSRALRSPALVPVLRLRLPPRTTSPAPPARHTQPFWICGGLPLVNSRTPLLGPISSVMPHSLLAQ